MPLRIECPNGCLIRMPGSRAGKMVRCPGCKTILQIPIVSRSVLNTDQPITLLATFATPQSAEPKIDSPTDAVLPESTDADATYDTKNAKTDARRRLAVPAFLPPSIGIGARTSATQARPEEQAADEASEPFAQPTQLQSDAGYLQETILIADRVQRANADRIILSRFFAFCLCGVAIVNMIPAVYYWYQWSQAATGQPLPRWTYLLILVAAIHVVYAIYVVQLPDWSTLKAVAAVMIVLAALFGLVSTGLAVGGGQGNVARFLNLPFALIRSGCIWCVAMLCLATLTSYLIGREAMNWQRVEQLMRQIESGA